MCTCSEKDLWRDVVGRPHQRVCQAALVLPSLPPLQGLEPVGAAAVGRVLPLLAEVHAVLPHVVAWAGQRENSGSGYYCTGISIQFPSASQKNLKTFFKTLVEEH